MKRFSKLSRTAKRAAGPLAAAALAAATLSALGTTTAQAAVTPSTWYTLVAGNSGKCVDAAAAATANDTAVQQYTCNGSTAQQWQFKTAVTSHQAWGPGVYCFMSTNPSVVADRAIEVPASGSSFHDMVTVSLGGDGTIRHVIDNTGGQVSSGTTVTYQTSGP